MKKELKDYLHLYLGCDATFSRTTWEVAGLYPENVLLRHRERTDELGLLQRVEVNYNEITIILRPLCDMTYDEINEFDEITKQHRIENGDSLIAKQVASWLSKHFDLFGLIESGLAISKPTLQKG